MPTACEAPHKEPPKIRYPSLRIEVMKEHKHLLKELEVDETGKATITFRVKKMVSGEDYGPANEIGSVELEIQDIKFAEASLKETEGEMMGKALANMGLGESAGD